MLHKELDDAARQFDAEYPDIEAAINAGVLPARFFAKAPPAPQSVIHAG